MMGFAALYPSYGQKTKKRRTMAPLSENQTGEGLRRLGFLFLHRAGILTLGVDVAVDELDHSHRGVVAIAEAGLDDAGVAALTILVARGQRVEQLLDHVDIAQLRDR